MFVFKILARISVFFLECLCCFIIFSSEVVSVVLLDPCFFYECGITTKHTRIS